MRAPRITESELRGALSAAEMIAAADREALQKKVEAVPEGWYRAETFAAECNRSAAQMRARLTAYVDQGIMECRQFRVDGGKRGAVLVNHYRYAKRPTN